ncbi:MAG: Fe-S cluster assembly scaffold protein NifU [Syntrophaceae bacterium CG2_30_49_12]|nr:MAG: Fe-S cluster assembly scaffold protein NifU [Syntrophaceae bacterium CG2_30_49_12]PIP06906.1 MAG: Fe-S cluster assembly scaffold protein NifU [Syntrophobacterales bacterium CG23_combo_of_CG06-09_8_20_14_all_48_27]PJA47598.1 MAG: Fe-S cluster assembly scaffold protein NifU [Syntrophobacterales bacterium CG_4_9_14_3_um_filter_49_8]PJC76457.1 MAG: Fe-S cluster assembly scaffold protein NifU [Syntrophobacterales bacterium CG_4_8_14_3_um_filter_49_14]
MYSEVVMDHFKNPRNVGKMEDADGIGEVGNPICGDMMTIYIKVKDDRIDDIKFLTFGCAAAIAVSSMLTEMARGKTLAEAKKITNKSVAEALEGLPKNKLHCSNLGADALHLAVKDYEDRKAGKVKSPQKSEDKHEHTEGATCKCPYCDADRDAGLEFCTHCGQEIKGKETVH